MNNSKILVLLRGVPGSGKTTIAKYLYNHITKSECFSADDYFTDVNGNYNWDANRVHLAHADCRARVEKSMQEEEFPIFVHNTFTRESEMKEYFELAEKYKYSVFTLIVENRHGSNNIHSVPKETLQKMKERFNVKL